MTFLSTQHNCPKSRIMHGSVNDSLAVSRCNYPHVILLWTHSQQSLILNCTLAVPRQTISTSKRFVHCFSSFISLIGELNELREKDYGDRQRGAQRWVEFPERSLACEIYFPHSTCTFQSFLHLVGSSSILESKYPIERCKRQT